MKGKHRNTGPNVSIQKIIGALPNSKDCRITVLGDYCLDKYLYIDPARDELSLETNLVAYQVHRKAVFPGAAGTVVNNLRALGAKVHCVGVVGNDGEGYELTAALEKIGADTSGLVKTDLMCTSTYTKPMRLQPDGSYKEMNRLDFRNFSETPEAIENEIIARLTAALKETQAVLVTDQFVERNLAVMTDRVRAFLCDAAEKNPNVFFYVDSRGFINEYKNVMVKCNDKEAAAVAKGNNADALISGGMEMYKRNNRPVFITLGAEGLYVFDGEAKHIEPFKVEGEIDIVGAGDATSAGIVLGLALGLSLEEAATLGCCVASITIQQIGITGTASIEEVVNRLCS